MYPSFGTKLIILAIWLSWRNLFSLFNSLCLRYFYFIVNLFSLRDLIEFVYTFVSKVHEHFLEQKTLFCNKKFVRGFFFLFQNVFTEIALFSEFCTVLLVRKEKLPKTIDTILKSGKEVRACCKCFQHN